MTSSVRYCCQNRGMRADRLLALMLLLRSRGRLSAATLARELEVSTRTVLRDVEALSSAGVPVYAERGRAGGFALLPGFTTDLTGLTPDEALALLTAGSRSDAAALGLAPALASAMRKVLAGHARCPPRRRHQRGRAGRGPARRVPAGHRRRRPDRRGPGRGLRRVAGCGSATPRGARTPPAAGAPSTRSAWSARPAGGTCWPPGTAPTAPTGCPGSPTPWRSTSRPTGRPAGSTSSGSGTSGEPGSPRR